MNAFFHKQFNKSLLDKDLLKKFPKIELHRHLEGSFDLETLYNLSVKNELDTPRNKQKFKAFCQFPRNHDSDFLLFLGKFHNNWYKSLDDISKIVSKSVENIKNDGLHYLELRFSPEHFSMTNNFDRQDVTKVIIKEADSMAKRINLNLKYILTFNRGKQSAHEMITLYKKILDLGIDNIVGVDLAGDETNFPPELFTQFFDFVKNTGIHKIDIHAGEISNSRQIWTAIDKLHANRIGHGISTIHDTKLQQELIERNIFLCQCVISNFQTASWPDTPSHPLPKLFRKGVPVSISSDDPTIQNASLIDDYYTIVKHFNFSIEDFIQINTDSIEASFLSEDQKSKVKKDYKKTIDIFLEENA